MSGLDIGTISETSKCRDIQTKLDTMDRVARPILAQKDVRVMIGLSSLRDSGDERPKVNDDAEWLLEARSYTVADDVL
jgi:hypothetical protein